MRGLIAFFLISGLVLALAACGGGGGEATPTPSLTAEDVAPDLTAALGVPATLHSPPVTETFGPDGGELELTDGATLKVPEGAFEEDTEVTVAIIDLDYGENVEAARLYRVSPEGGLEVLNVPLSLEGANLGNRAFGLQFLEDGYEYRSYAENGDLSFPVSNSSGELVQSGPTLLQRATTTNSLSSGEYAIIVCGALFADAVNEPGDKAAMAAFYVCLLSFGLHTESCQDAAREASLDPLKACGDPEWVFEMVDARRTDLRIAGVDTNEQDIVFDLDAWEICLADERSSGNSRGEALDACASLEPAVPASPTGATTAAPTATATPAPTAIVTAPPAPTDPPAAAPTAPPSPTLTFLEGPSGFVLREYDHTEDLCAGDTCRDYEVEGRLAWSGLEAGGYLQCYGSGRPDEGFRVAVDPPSGEMAFDLDVSRWQFDFHPFVICQLLAADDSLLDSVSQRVQVE